EVDPQMDWQDVGRKLWNQFIYHLDQFRQAEADLDQIRRQLFALRQEMVVACAPEGDVPSFVRWLLTSQTKFTRLHREILLDLLEENIFTKLKPKRGRPQQRLVRLCGSLAIDFYQRWKDGNRRNGINDWGHRKEMKDEACRLAIELVYPQQNAPKFEQVRELIERPAVRREAPEL